MLDVVASADLVKDPLSFYLSLSHKNDLTTREVISGQNPCFVFFILFFLPLVYYYYCYYLESDREKTIETYSIQQCCSIFLILSIEDGQVGTNAIYPVELTKLDRHSEINRGGYMSSNSLQLDRFCSTPLGLRYIVSCYCKQRSNQSTTRITGIQSYYSLLAIWWTMSTVMDHLSRHNCNFLNGSVRDGEKKMATEFAFQDASCRLASILLTT